MADASRMELGGGYSLEITSDLKGVVYNAKGKKLASVPPKVRKLEPWQRWQELQKNHQDRLQDNEAIVVGWMVSGEKLSGEVLCTMWQDPAWQAKLKGLLLVGDGHDTSGMLMGASSDRGLGIVTQDLESTWVKGTWWRVPHLADFSADEVEAWQACSVDSGIAQGLRQLTRPLHLPTAAELAGRTSSRFSDQRLHNAAYISHAFNARGWSTLNGVARCSYGVIRPERDPLKLSARFEYFAGGDYGDWDTECTTGDLSFVGGEGNPLRMRDVPTRVFSEACTTITAIVKR